MHGTKEEQQWRVPLNSLGNNLSEARELAAVLEETLGLRVDYGTVVPRSATTLQPRGHSFKDRLRSGTPIAIDDRSIDWCKLRCVVSTESLKAGDDLDGRHPGHAQLEVNSGGRVFFCFFAPHAPGEPEGVAVLKFGPNRLLMQAEQFANELTRHLDICAPECRIVRQAGASSEEWRALSEACTRLGGSHGAHAAAGGGPGVSVGSGAGELASELSSLPVVLLMEFCPGWPLLECQEAFMSSDPQLCTFEELGRLFLLDAVLGNADRLPCADLSWRGNPNNILYGKPGSRCAAHIVAIDSCVQRRPPAARLSAEDAGVDRLAQLLLTDQDVALELLRGSVLAHSPPGLATLAAAPAAAAEAFQRGFRECLGRVERIKGLLEMMHSKMHDWSMEFITDIKALRPELPIPTPAVAVSGLTSAAGAAASGRLVAHYGPLNIRVNSSGGGGVSGGGAAVGRGRVAWTGGNSSSTNSGLGSPARPRQSPYLASIGRTNSAARNRNFTLGGVVGGTGGSSAFGGVRSDGLGATPPSITRRLNATLGGLGSASRANSGNISGRSMAAVQAGSPLGSGPSGGGGGGGVSVGDGGVPWVAGGGGGEGSEAISKVSDGGLGFGSVGGAPSIEPDLAGGSDPRGAPGVAAAADGAVDGAGVSRLGGCGGRAGANYRRGPIGQLQRKAAAAVTAVAAAAAGALGGGGGAAAVSRFASVGGAATQQGLQRRGSGLLAAAGVALPEWLMKSPYLVSGPGGFKAGALASGLSAMAGRCRSMSASGLSRCGSSSQSASSNSSGSTGAPAAAAAANNSVRRRHQQHQQSTPQSRLAPTAPKARGCGRGAADDVTVPYNSPRLPRLARSSSPAGTFSNATATSWKMRRLSDTAISSTGTSHTLFAEAASKGLRRQQPVEVVAAPTACSGNVAAAVVSRSTGGGGGRPTGPSLGILGIHSRSLLCAAEPGFSTPRVSGVLGVSVGGGGAGAGGAGALTPTLRHSRSFGGLLRSPRRMFSPATPKFRSPVLGPRDAAAATTATATEALLPAAADPGSAEEGLLQRPSSPSAHPPCGSDGDAAGGRCSSAAPERYLIQDPGQHPHPHPHQYPPQLQGQGQQPLRGATLAAQAAGAVGVAPAPGPNTTHSGPCSNDHCPAATAATGSVVHLSAPKPPLPRLCSLRSGASMSGASSHLPSPHAPSHLNPSQLCPVPLTTEVAVSPPRPPGPPTSEGPSTPFSFNPSGPHLATPKSIGGTPATSLPTPSSAASAAAPPLAPTATPTPTNMKTPTHTPTPSSSTCLCPPAASTTSTPYTPMGSWTHPNASSTTSPSPSPSPAPSPSPNLNSISGKSNLRSGAARTCGGGGGGGVAGLGGSSSSSKGIRSGSNSRRAAGGVAGPVRLGAGAVSAGGVSSARGGYGSTRSTPGGGSVGKVIVRTSPNHASPYEQFKSDMSLTLALKSITVEARKDDLLSSRVQHWKELFRARGEELKAAVGEWQSRHQLERVLTTGFLDGTHPIVDTYELKVRLEHMLRRLQVLQEAAAAQKPSQVLEAPGGLFLGGAVCADSHHILRHLGITHIVNATEELLLPPPTTGFVVLRVALRDVDDEDISRHFKDVAEFIQSCHASGGNVLVHCSEGKSRSVTLVLAYLMRERGWRLKAAFDHVKSCRAVACPNAGFMNRLLSYERELYGDNSYIPQQLKKAKPEPVMCPLCGAAVGISSASLNVHMKRVHHITTAATAGGGAPSPRASSPAPSPMAAGTAAARAAAATTQRITDKATTATVDMAVPRDVQEARSKGGAAGDHDEGPTATAVLVLA